MKTLNDYSEEIYKCSKCGLCQSICPVFEATGLETAVSRGKFTLLNGIIHNQVKFTKNLSKNLDLCLGCKACYDFCPSSISAEEIIISARNANYKINGASFIKQFIVSNFDSPLRMFILKVLLSLYRSTGFIKLANAVSFLAGKNIKRQITLFNSIVKENVKYRKLAPAKEKSDLKIVYFPGCINKYVNPSVKNSVLTVLEKNGMKVDIPDFSCCGIPARNIGDIDTFIKQAKQNLDLISADIDYLITDCASCGSVWKIYEEVLEGDYKEKASIIAEKAIDINKFLSIYPPYLPEGLKENKVITYHDPCHLKRSQGVYKEPREILKGISGAEFVELNEADKCCGAAGTFCAANPEISQKISSLKAKNILDANADIVATSCPSCKIGITQGLLQFDRQMPVYHTIEILAKIYLREI